jgi:DNA-binding NarL/FixJ family response regulator
MTTDDPAPASRATLDGAPSLRLLIADDDRFVRTALAAALGVEFEIVATAADASDAIALAAEHKPDAAIVDVDMPGGGGLRATREIRGISPRTAVIVLSGDESDGVVRDVINAGATTYVRKGTPRAELSRVVRTSVAAVRQDA